MATAQLGAVLRHIRHLADDPTMGEPSDGALLRAFLGGNDPSAFAALVRRHGPMVLQVCRRTLGNAHDAEDALQATFLTLARQAASIRKRESLASWLHGVAYRMATDARKAAARRQRHESRASPPPPRDPALSAAWRELQGLLDEEVARLPEALRGPFVLCCVQDQTCAEAARQLGLQEGTVWNRLGRARKRLKERLTRRGVALTTALAAVVVGVDGAAAGVPRPLVAIVVKAAAQLMAGQALAGGPVSGHVLALVEGVNRTMFLNKCKTAILQLVGTALVGAGLGMAVVRGAACGEPPPDPLAPPEAAREGPKKGRPQAADAPAKDKDAVPMGGRVLDADGKPVAAADVALLVVPKSSPSDYAGLSKEVLAHGRADGAGRFRLSVSRAALADSRAAYVIAGKAGHGLAWAPADLNRPAEEALVRLAPEKVIRGRLIDVQGQPTPGVRVSLTMLGEPRRNGVYLFHALPRESLPSWPGPATTGKDGKFVLAGLSPDLEGYLKIDGEEFAIASAHIKAGQQNRNQEVNLTLSPARTLEGVVTAADTGKPVPGARVSLIQSDAACQADDKGRYRLRLPAELPVSGFYDDGYSPEVKVLPPEGQTYLPYLHLQTGLKWPKGAVKHHLDLTLPRGVLVRGTVTDAATGQPIAGAVAKVIVPEYTVPASKSWYPHIPQASTGADGTFAVAVPPGRRGHLLVKGPNGNYVAVEITGGELSGGTRGGWRNYPDAVIPFEAKAGTQTLEVTAKLRRGVTIRGKLFGPDNKPVNTVVGFVCEATLRVQDGTFELRGCNVEVTYPVYFLDAKNKIGATARLSAKEAAGKEVTVHLEPCGSAVVRFVDKAGKPAEFKGEFVPAWLVRRPGVAPGGMVVGGKGLLADVEILENTDHVNYRNGLHVDARGQCALPVLIPGATYLIGDNPRFMPRTPIKELTVKAGEALKMEFVIDRP
jgi:RNA polymerase sigma factor (sigma-70 family)